MPKQMIMDHTGHSTHVFDKADVVSLDEAEKRFKDLTGKGFRAVALGTDGEPGEVIKSFDPTIDATLFIPQLQGG